MNQELLKQITEELLQGMKVQAEVSVAEIENGFKVVLSTEQSGILIGWHGEGLGAFQHVLRTIYTAKTGEFGSIVVDVNDYRSKQEKTLMDLAHKAAAMARNSGSDQVLRPMSGYERKVVHATLASFGDVVTESIGEEPYRKIIVKKRIEEI